MRYRAWTFSRFGNPWEVLTLTEHFMESLTENVVRVRFLGSPINPSDLNQIEGNYPVKPESFPAIGGNEGIARVEEVGKEVSNLKVGDLVVPGKSGLGCWRDFAVLKVTELIKIPNKWNNLPLEILATIKVNPPTAYRLLKDFVTLKKGDLIVQNGANSAVGRLTIQMASLMGLRTLNVIRDRPDFDKVAVELSELDVNGGAKVIKSEDFKDYKVECDRPVLGLNCVGGGAVVDMSKVMSTNGTIVTYGAMSRRPLTVAASSLIFKNLTFKGFWLTSWYQTNVQRSISDAEYVEKMFEDILSWYRDGQLKATKSFWIDLKGNECEGVVNNYLKESCGAGRGGIDRGKCIIRFI